MFCYAFLLFDFVHISAINGTFLLISLLAASLVGCFHPCCLARSLLAVTPLGPPHRPCRDIKPENLLFTADHKLKVADFGLAIDLREERAVTRAGTLDYMPPEILNCPFKSLPSDNKDQKHLHYGQRVDAWAVSAAAKLSAHRGRRLLEKGPSLECCTLPTILPPSVPRAACIGCLQVGDGAKLDGSSAGGCSLAQPC